jgi:rhodanese-related sulfurtransferase
MNWKSLFSPVGNMTADEARSYIKNNPGDSFQLLDVRQPKEYANQHLPGALLIPLKELPTRIEEIDKAKPTIAYCAPDGRSRAAAQFLAGRKFKKVFNLKGGIKAWEGEKAYGPEEMGLAFFSENGDFADGLAPAYAMEDGLQLFYLRLLQDSTDPEQQKLLKRLASFEDIHKKNLLDQYRQVHGENAAMPYKLPAIMEGGRRVEDFLKRAPPCCTTQKTCSTWPWGWKSRPLISTAAWPRKAAVLKRKNYSRELPPKNNNTSLT